MNKLEALKKLEQLLEEVGAESSRYKEAFEKFVNDWGKPSRSIPRPGEITDGKKKGRDRDFFGKQDPPGDATMDPPGDTTIDAP